MSTGPNNITKVSRQVFNDAFIELGGVDGLVKWAKGLEGTCTIPTDGNNLKLFYTLFAKVLPREIKTEDLNRSHEQFIELMQMERQHQLETRGQPVGFIDAPTSVSENVEKITKDT